MLQGEQLLEEIVAEGAQLPPTQQVLPKLQALLRSDDTDLAAIQELLRVDTGMSAKLIRAANSSYYGGAAKVDSLEGAINRLGFRETYRLASIAASRDTFGSALAAYGLQAFEMLRKSVLMALLLSEMATVLRRSDRDAHYTIGLMHSIGKVLLNSYFLKKGLDLYSAVGVEMSESACDAFIHQTVGLTYAEVGAELLRRWEFPDHIVEPIARQLDAPSDNPSILVLGLQVLPIVYHLVLAKDPDMAGLDSNAALAFGFTEENFQLAVLRCLSEYAKISKMID